jgi:predicted secreted protein
LDTLTGGVFTAPTSGERSARLREWLLTEPSLEHMQDVYKELSSRDKGAAKNLREKLDELKKARGQDALAAEWAERAQQLLGSPRLNIADALAWQRDAAKAGAPLSREPLAGLKVQLAEVVKTVDDLQHQVMVQREAAVLLAQRVEVLSTKSWKEAQAVHASLQADVAQWQQQAQDLTAQAGWPSVDMKFPPQLEASRHQLRGVWDAFEAALSQAHVAQTDPSAPLPQVLVWADELRALRGEVAVVAPVAEGEKQAKPAKPKLDPAQRQALREQATQAVLAVLTAVETEVTEGHGKASAGAATALRQVLKEHGRHLDTALDARVHAALTAAGELEGWQRWRADQLRQELVAKAEALFKPVVVRKPKAPRVALETAAAPADSASHAGTESTAAVDAVAQVTAAQDASLEAATEAADVAVPEVTAEVSVAETAPETKDETAAFSAAPSAAAAEPAPAKIPAMGGRKMQETLRQLRDQWKLTDQGGTPNHALWKRFDAACNEAYKVVQEWLDKLKHEAVEHRGQRLAMMEELRAWGQAHAENTDWKLQLRTLHQFGDRWRNAGHLSEKAFAELQPQWKKVIQQAAAPLEAAQKASLERRHALIAEAEVLGAAPGLRVDAVKVLQQRWQTEAQTVPLERKLEQKLWESFRQPIDEAFNRKTVEREQVSSQTSAHDRAVLDASRALETANASGDVQKIRAAMQGLDAALRGQAVAVAAEQAAASAPVAVLVAASEPVVAAADTEVSAPDHHAETEPVESAVPADETAEASAEAVADAEPAAPEVVVPVAPVKAPARPVVAVRGDDRPGQKRTELAPAGRGGKFGDRREGGRDGRPSDRGDRGGRPNDRFGDRAERPDRGPRLGDAAFRAQRDALEHAEMTLRKLASQAHGETLGNLMSAWETRQTEALPSAQDLGKGVNAATRSAWAQSVQAAPGPQTASQAALLRLEMAAEVPTPAEFLNERRALQLQLLTRRNEPGPVDTWRQDVGAVLASAHDGNSARRLQNVLKQLLKR